MNIYEILDKLSKQCPNCQSKQLSTMNNKWPLNHRCLDCGAIIEEKKSGIMTVLKKMS